MLSHDKTAFEVKKSDGIVVMVDRARNPPRITLREVTSSFAGEPWASKFPPILTVDQVTELLQVPKGSVYDWSSRGLLNGCSVRVGKHLRFYRDRLIQEIFQNCINNGDQN